MSEKQYDIAITVGVFDLLHEGHVELFEMMREMADKTIALVHNDLSTWKNKKRWPVQGHTHRKQNVRNFVDGVGNIKMPDPGERLAELLSQESYLGGTGRSIVYVRGDDWPDFPGRAEIEKLGIPIVFKKYTKGVSSTERRKEL